MKSWRAVVRKWENAEEPSVQVYLILITSVFHAHRLFRREGWTRFITFYVLCSSHRLSIPGHFPNVLTLNPLNSVCKVGQGTLCAFKRCRNWDLDSWGPHFRLSGLPEVTQLVCKNRLVLRCPSSTTPTCSHLGWRRFCPQGDTWQCLETVMIIPIWGVGGLLLASSG